jgi:hypothetical protein
MRLKIKVMSFAFFPGIEEAETGRQVQRDKPVGGAESQVGGRIGSVGQDTRGFGDE